MDKIDKRTDSLVTELTKHFGAAPTHVAIRPGRVNLIGEHTNYNDGYVLPIALHRDVRVMLRSRADRTVQLYSLEYDSHGSFNLDTIDERSDLPWMNYVKGVAWVLQDVGEPLSGMDALISGNVPRGAGLSSSAALEVATAYAFNVCKF